MVHLTPESLCSEHQKVSAAEEQKKGGGEGRVDEFPVVLTWLSGRLFKSN